MARAHLRKAIGALAIAGLLSSVAHARPGDLDEPLLVPGFPFVHVHSTAGHASLVGGYGCAPTISEGGPEVVYEVSVPRLGTLVASVADTAGVVDVDLQIVESTRLSSEGRIDACVARGNVVVQAPVQGGTYYVVVDTYENGSRAGAYKLRIDYQPTDDWYERPLAQGVTLRTRKYSRLFETQQFTSVLLVDPAAGAVVQAYRADVCAPLPQLASATRAVAAVTGGPFAAATCADQSFVKIDGRVVVGAGSPARSAFGIDHQGRGLVRAVGDGGVFEGAEQALGGLPRIASDGGVDVRTSEEGAPSLLSDSFDARTFAATTASGRVVLGTVDGLTSASQGLSLPLLASWLLGLGFDVRDAVNLAGNSAATLWARGQPWDGVINYPTHGRGNHVNPVPIRTAWLVFAAPLDHPPVFLTTPSPATLAAGETYVYEAVAAELEGRPLSFSLSTAGQGLRAVEDRGDSSARFTYVPRNADVAASPLTLDFVVTPLGGPATTQSVQLVVTPGVEPDGGDAGDAGVADGGVADGGVPDGGVASADAGEVDAGSSLGDGGARVDGGLRSDGGSATADGGVSPQAPSGCAMDATEVGGLALLAALWFWLGRRRAWGAR